MNIRVPELSLVVLIGASGSGKSTFARKLFKSTEILNSDTCRALVSDDENDLSVTKEAFEVLHFIAAKRLEKGKLTVIDATNVQRDARKPLIALARKYHCLPVAIILDMPEELCWQRTQERPDRSFGRHVLRSHRQQLRRSIKGLKREGFRFVYRLRTLEEVNDATIERQRLWNNLKHENGPFDIIGDVHGCADELEELLTTLGYQQASKDAPFQHPDGRKAIFVGDLVDRGPRVLDTIAIARNMSLTGNAICVPGNHDMKLMRSLKGNKVQITHGLAESLAEIEALPEDERTTRSEEIIDFFHSMVSHYVLDEGRLVVAHAGMKEEMQGRGSARVRDFALYGETTGETDEFGLPVRYNWAKEYRGNAMVVYGHTPVPEPDWLNRTINVDTGCVFGGHLTALRYPEKELVSVPAKRVYAEPAKPFLEEGHDVGDYSSQADDKLPRIDDVLGKRIINTRLRGNITIREENALAALEVMSRFAADPKWLIYLPPTMSPSETSQRDGYLEHPEEAFTYFRSNGTPRVVCEKKHMGSRAVVIVCRDGQVAADRFGVNNGKIGICYTRTGRRFFNDTELETAFLERINKALTRADWWKKFSSDWFCLDCELMPWSAKAQALLERQYAAVGAASKLSLTESVRVLKDAAERTGAVNELLFRFEEKQRMAGLYAEAYAQYCWPVNGLSDFKLAPFHLMASEGQTYFDKDHVWHMDTIAELCAVDEGLLLATTYKVIDVTDADSCAAGVEWWEEMTKQGGEGMVVKPFAYVEKGKRGLVQPGLKSRGREYLRIIYGPEYTAQENLKRLRSRGLSGKRSMAMREFALGVEALERFVRKEPLYRVHECVFGVLALESEPVDPRL